MRTVKIRNEADEEDMLDYTVNTSKSSLSPSQNAMAISCEASVSLLDILEILQRFLLNFKLIAYVDVRTALVKLFVILSMRVQLAPS